MASTLVVEDGTGLANADSFISAVDAATYHTNHNNTAWAALTDAQKDAALRYATAYVDTKFQYLGYLYKDTQSLSWPRTDAWDMDRRLLTGVPQKVKDAVCELALVHATTENVNATFDRGGAIASEEVGSVKVAYFDRAPAGVTYPFLIQMLARVTLGGGVGTIPVVRA